VIHLAAREIASTHRFTLLGWAWPLVRQLSQLGVLVFIFTKVVRLQISHYPEFVFSGLIAWSWFSSGVIGSSTSLYGGRHLVFRPRFPAIVLPAVAVVVPLVDVLLALPVLFVMLALSTGLSASLLLLPLLLAIQLVLMCGIGWIVAAGSVFLRDVQNLTAVAVTILFYMTPVFYPLSQAGNFEWVLRLNPMTTLVDSYRDILLRGALPNGIALGAIALASVAIAGAGLLFFHRLAPRFVDEL
jgi:lipopolysaccharide transport system permease protein